MFKIASQTVLLPPAEAYDEHGVLNPDAADMPRATMNFRTNDADTSKCILDITTPSGDLHRLVFNAGGQLDRLGLVLPEGEPEDVIAADKDLRANNTDEQIKAMGRDPSAFDAMTYKAPVNPDAAQRDDGIKLGAPVAAAASPVIPPSAVATGGPAPGNPPPDASGRASGPSAGTYDPRKGSDLDGRVASQPAGSPGRPVKPLVEADEA